MMDKASIRKLMNTKKASLSAEDKQREADMVLRSIEKMPCFQKAQSVLMYYSLPDELPTHNFVLKWAAEKKVYLPRVVGDDLEIAIYGELATDGKYGIEEPTAASVSPDEIDLVIVPAVALDIKGNRLGRGKGYYDRLLPQCPQAYKIGVALECQLLEELPVDPFDVPLDAVFTASNEIIITPFSQYTKAL